MRFIVDTHKIHSQKVEFHISGISD